ncbi:MAG: tetratricopeptide repeat protein [Bacteroidota bacterium]
MPGSPNHLFRIWQELKHRNVIRVVIGYLAAAYVILEFTSIISDPFGLPPWTLKLVFVLLCAGFIIVVLLAWLYDHKQGGLEKTETIQERKELADEPAVEQEEETTGIQRKIRIRASDYVIAVLLVTVCILLFPRIFKKDRLEEIRDESGIVSVSVMPFENLTGDLRYDIWQGGFQNLIISALSNSKELRVRQYMTMSNIMRQNKDVDHASISPSRVMEIASDLETPVVVLGRILKTGNLTRYSAQLIDAETGDSFKTFLVECEEGKDVFIVADSLGSLIRNYLEIKKMFAEYKPVEVNEIHYTTSAEAFQYYIHAYQTFSEMDVTTTVEWLIKVIETDPEFIEAYVFLSFVYAAKYDFMQSKAWCDSAYSKGEVLPVRSRLQLNHLHAYHYETPYEEIKYCKQVVELDRMNITYWYLMGDAYYRLGQYKEAIFVWEKTLEIHRKWGAKIYIPHLYAYMGDALHQIGDHKREKEIYEMAPDALKKTSWLTDQQAICALSQGKRDRALEYIRQFRAAGIAKDWNEARILSGIGYIYLEAGLIDQAEKYYRQGVDLDPDNPNRLNGLAWCLIDNDININEGVEIAKRAIEISPESSMVLDTYGWGLYKQGKPVEALKMLNKAWELRNLYTFERVRRIKEVEKALSAQSGT